jgi:hypothetical protein
MTPMHRTSCKTISYCTEERSVAGHDQRATIFGQPSSARQHSRSAASSWAARHARIAGRAYAANRRADVALHGATGTATGRGASTRDPNRGAAAARLGLLLMLSDDYGAVRNSKTVDVRFVPIADISISPAVSAGWVILLAAGP